MTIWTERDGKVSARFTTDREHHTQWLTTAHTRPRTTHHYRVALRGRCIFSFCAPDRAWLGPFALIFFVKLINVQMFSRWACWLGIALFKCLSYLNFSIFSSCFRFFSVTHTHQALSNVPCFFARVDQDPSSASRVANNFLRENFDWSTTKPIYLKKHVYSCTLR